LRLPSLTRHSPEAPILALVAFTKWPPESISRTATVAPAGPKPNTEPVPPMRSTCSSPRGPGLRKHH
jgi:hypothetical protein